MARTMGFDLGLNSGNTCFKRKFRWMFFVDGVSGDGINALPPVRSSRPSLSFKEMEAQHLNETIYYPSKPDWKPLPLSLYDIKKDNEHPVFEWFKWLYDPSSGDWNQSNWIKRKCRLELYDGCGKVLEEWIFENAWPQNIEFGELDMASSDVVTVDLTLRYDRAYLK